MAQPFAVCPLSESWWLEVVYKLSPKTLCRLRQMCKSMDNLVEHHRFKIARHAQYQFNLDILVQNDNIYFYTNAVIPIKEIPLAYPYKQLSAVPFNLITLTATVARKRRQDLINLLMKISLLKKLELQCRTLCIASSNCSEEVQKILECITTEQLRVTLVHLSLQQFLSSQVVQKLKKLTVILDFVDQRENFARGSYLNYLKHMPSVDVNFEENHQAARDLAKNILMDIYKSNDIGKITCLKFHFTGTVNSSPIYDELYEVEWIKRPSLNYQLGGLFFAEVNSYFLVVMHYASKKDYYRHAQHAQQISISFYEKDLDNLKDVLIRAAGSRDWGDKCFEKIVNRFNYIVME